MIKLCKFNFYVSLYGKCIVRRQEPMKIEFKKPLLYDVHSYMHYHLDSQFTFNLVLWAI